MSYGQQQGGWSDQSWPNPNQPYSDPGYQDPGYQDPGSQGYPGYPASAGPAGPGYGYGYQAPAPRHTNGLAIAAMVVSLASIFACGFPAIVGAIMGHVARKQIRERGEDGDGMALTGVIAGWIIFALTIIGWGLWFILVVWLATSAPEYEPAPGTTY